MNENENLNLVEILKDAPQGTKLWSTICGDCVLAHISSDDSEYPIECISKDLEGCYTKSIIFTAKGTFFYYCANDECILFPSRENRDWSTFKAPDTHKHFEPFQKVLCVADNNHDCEVWSADLYSHYDESTSEHYLVSGFVKADDEVIPYEGNEDRLGKLVK